MTATNSAGREAERIRQYARRGVWRRATAALGWNPAARRADARAALWEHGARGEETTARMLAPLQRVGWKVEHDRRLRGCRWNVDTVIVPPCGTAVIVLDTKAWRKNWTTHVDPRSGRVFCEHEDRHEKVEKVAGYAQRIAAELGIGGLKVLPLLVVHGSPVAGGCLAARVEGVSGPVFVLSPSWLVSTLTESAGVPHAGRAGVVAARVDQVLVPYG